MASFSSFTLVVVLEGYQYAKSRLYDASGEDIFDIFAILQKSKEIMMRFV